MLSRLRFTNLPDLTFEIRQTEVIIKTSETSRLSTILGSNSNHIVVSGEAIKRIPHDFCLACMTDIVEGKQIFGLTPDIVFEDNSFIEVTTNQVNTMDSLIDSINDKLTKYSALIDQGLEYNIVAISRSYVVCHSGSINADHKRILQQAYNVGLNILNEYDQMYPGDSKELHNMLSNLPMVEINYPKLDLPEIDEIKLDFSHHTFKDYVDKFSSSTYLDFGTMIHLPWCIPQVDGNMIEYPTDDESLMGRLWTSALIGQHTNTQHTTGFVVLEYYSNMKIKNVDQFKDQMRERLSEADRVELAMSGLWAKKLKNHPALTTQREKLKNGLSYNNDVDEIDYFIGQDVKIEEYLSAPCLFIDKIVRELILNCKRNIKRVGEFIVRKFKGLDAFILIKPTKKGVDDDRPIFFSIACRNPVILNESIFSRWQNLGNGWLCTKFYSMTLKNCESLISLDCQMRAHIGLIKEELKGADTSRIALMTLLILISDSNEVSLFCQNLRYYYMELYSGFAGTKRAEKISSKFPFPVRNKLTLYLIKKLLSIHMSLPIKLKFESVKDQDDEIQHDPLPHVDTPFGFTISNSLHLLRASYMSMLKNKDAQNKGHDSKVILNKMMKWEYFRIDNKQNPQPTKLSEYKEFNFSEEALFKACKSYKRMLAKRNGMSESQLDDHVLSKSVKRTKMADLATTKSSSIATISESVDRRSKVFVELLSKVNFESAYLYGNIMKVIDNWSWESKAISLFKKNQIGGVREIYILPIELRLMVRTVEDISRTLCELDENEKLTDHSGKDFFVDQHYLKAQVLKGPFIKTLKWSGDMSNWANLFQMRQFDILASVMFPKKLHGVYMKVSEIMKSKRFWIPDALRQSFNKRVYTELATEEMTRFKNEYYSLNGDSILPDRLRFTMESNMMQGIFHYTSSDLHLIYFHFIEEEMKSQIDFPFVFSVEVSSDDEGVLISIDADSEKLIIERMKIIQRVFLKVKKIADLLFGVRTSKEKSTLSWRDIFEFNSKFFFGNCVRSPLIKFVTRSVDDNPAETLRDRISSFHNSLRTLRENGCSGSLCKEIAVEQKIGFERNLGSDMGWFDDDAKKILSHFKLSYLGWYELPDDMTAGLVNVDYFDWLNSTSSLTSLIAASKILPRAGLLLTDNISLRFDLWKTKKFKRMLESLKINTQFSLRDLEISLTRPESSDVERRLIEIMAMSPGVAKCYSRLDRNECVSLSSYLLYSNIFLNKSLSQIIDECSQLKQPLLPEEYLFPLRSQYVRVRSLTSVQRFKIPLDEPRRSRLSTFYPAVSRNIELSNTKFILTSIWFGKGKLDAYHLAKQVTIIKSIFPWFNEDPDVCLENSPFESFLELKAFTESLSKQDKPLKIISRANKVGDVLESLIEYDTYPGFRFIMPPTDFKHEEESNVISATLMNYEGAYLKWQKLAPYITTHNLSMSDIMTIHLDGYRSINKVDIIPVIKSFTRIRSNFHCSLALVYGIISPDEFLSINPTKFRFYHTIDKYEEVIIMKEDSSLIKIRVQGCYIVEAVATDLKLNWHQIMSKHNLTFGVPITEGKITLPDGDKSFEIKKGIIRVRIGNFVSSSVCSPSAYGSIDYDLSSRDPELDRFLTIWFRYDKDQARGVVSDSVLMRSTACPIIREIIKQVYNRSVIIRLRERSLYTPSDEKDDSADIEEKVIYGDHDILNLIEELAPDEDDLEVPFEDTIMETFAESGVSTFEADPSQLINTSSELIFNIIGVVKSFEDNSSALTEDMRKFLISCGVKLSSRGSNLQTRRIVRIKGL